MPASVQVARDRLPDCVLIVPPRHAPLRASASIAELTKLVVEAESYRDGRKHSLIEKPQLIHWMLGFSFFSRGRFSNSINSSALLSFFSSVKRVRLTGDNPNSEQNARTCFHAAFDTETAG